MTDASPVAVHDPPAVRRSGASFATLTPASTSVLTVGGLPAPLRLMLPTSAVLWPQSLRCSENRMSLSDFGTIKAEASTSPTQVHQLLAQGHQAVLLVIVIGVKANRVAHAVRQPRINRCTLAST